jgi:hypothetical protein
MTVYSDFDFNFIKIVSKDINTKEDVNAINQSIINILLTHRGEVPFDPLFGSGIHHLLFEKMTRATELMLREEIKAALENHEPRIRVDLIELIPDYDGHHYEVDLQYTILYLSTTESVKLELQLQGI